jgi:hypothetical protein
MFVVKGQRIVNQVRGDTGCGFENEEKTRHRLNFVASGMRQEDNGRGGTQGYLL